MRVRGVRRRVDARGAYLMTLAGALAYYAGQIITQPTFATSQGLGPVTRLVPMDTVGWLSMACASAVAAAAVLRRRWWWVDRWGFALATFPLVVWFGAFVWSWVSAGCNGYPLGGTWAFIAAGATIANVKLDRGAQGTTEDAHARWSERWIGAWDSDRDPGSPGRGVSGEGGGTAR